MENKSKDDKMFPWIAGLIIVAFSLLGYLFYNMYYAACEPCAYLNYKNEVEPGYEVKSKHENYCFPCEHAATPGRALDTKSPDLYLAPCPKKYWVMYNENVIKMNAEFIKNGYEPKFKPVEIKNEKNN